MGKWAGKWFDVAILDCGGINPASPDVMDCQTGVGYLEIHAWNPAGRILESTLHQVDAAGAPQAMPLPLHFISGTYVNFQAWSQWGDDVTSAFQVGIKGAKKRGKKAIRSGSLETVGEYQAQASTDPTNPGNTTDFLHMNGVTVNPVQVPAEFMLP
jgi:hypothetical protein